MTFVWHQSITKTNDLLLIIQLGTHSIKYSIHMKYMFKDMDSNMPLCRCWAFCWDINVFTLRVLLFHEKQLIAEELEMNANFWISTVPGDVDGIVPLAHWCLILGSMCIWDWQLNGQHNAVETKLPAFHRRYFRMHFIVWKCMDFTSDCTRVWSWGSN